MCVSERLTRGFRFGDRNTPGDAIPSFIVDQPNLGVTTRVFNATLTTLRGLCYFNEDVTPVPTYYMTVYGDEVKTQVIEDVEVSDDHEYVIA